MAIQKTDDVQTYFTERAKLFDALYEDNGFFGKLFNNIFRRPMFTRYVYTLEAIGNLEGKTILDVGCGAGRYSVELATKGATVVGVDFSEEMLTMARKRAQDAGMSNKMTFVSADFVEWAKENKTHFDVAFAMGVIDYIDDAPAFTAMMAEVADNVIISFPRPGLIRMPLRKLRYWLRNCPVHFYRKKEIELMYHNAGVPNINSKKLGLSGYWVHGKKGFDIP